LWEENNLAVCIYREDRIDVGSVICYSVAIDRKSGNGFDVDELIDVVLLIGGRSHGEVFAVLKEVRRTWGGESCASYIISKGWST